MTRDQLIQASKVPAVTFGFWVIKILATTLGETGGDSVSMTLIKDGDHRLSRDEDLQRLIAAVEGIA